MSEKQNSQTISVSIVVLFYNEEKLVEEFFKRTVAVLERLNISYEIVAVDDGSRDQTYQKLVELSRVNPKICLVPLARNRGQAIALQAGVTHSRGDKVVIMDGDLQHLPEDIPRLIHEMDKGYDLVSGSRTKRKENMFFRRIPSFFANLLIRKITGCTISDMGGYKIIRGDIARNLVIRPGYHRFLPVLVHLMGGKNSEIFVAAPIRERGTSHYGIGLSRTTDVFLDILLLWLRSSCSSRPLYFVGRFTIAIFIFATTISAYLLHQKFWSGISVTNRPAFYISLMLYSISLMVFICALGLEIISDLYSRVHGIPHFLVRADYRYHKSFDLNAVDLGRES